MIFSILKNFDIKGEPTSFQKYGNGHINSTYRIASSDGSFYILQKINKSVFKDPPLLMRNIHLVINHLAARADSDREVLSLVPTLDQKTFIQDEDKEYWRMYDFVRDSLCLEKAESTTDFYESAVAFGKFHNMLIDFPSQELTETIPNFHNTVLRYQALKNAIKADTFGRAKEVKDEIEFALRFETFASTFTNLTAEGQLPLRVTHNDTKLNNVLFDKKTRKGLCVIDLDTVMPGLSINDYGDSIRFGASTASEDENNLDKVWVDLELYTLYTKGFLYSCGKNLTNLEIELLPAGAKMMTLECGVRFLTDYLSGDTYFKTHYSKQNLYRCRTQFKLVSDMDSKWKQMNDIVLQEALL